MGAVAVGTTAIKKLYCLCVLDSGKEVFLAVRTSDEALATAYIHRTYMTVEYVLDVFTPLQMQYRKRHLQRSTLTSVALN